MGMTLGFGPTADLLARAGYAHWYETSVLFRSELTGPYHLYDIDSSVMRAASWGESAWERWDHTHTDVPDGWVLVDDAPECPEPPEEYVNV